MSLNPLPSIRRGGLAFIRGCRDAIIALTTPEGRRAWALIFLAGGGAAMTGYALYALWLVRDHASYVFWLGVFAHVSIIIVLTGFAGLLVKRRVQGKIKDLAEIGIDDIEVVD